MDKYEFNIRTDQLKKMARIGDYENAQSIADGIDWRRVNNVSLLSIVSEVYANVGDYSEAKEILLLAYERSEGGGKRLLYTLTELAVKEGSLEEAEHYFREFEKLMTAENRQDSRIYLLRYMILQLKGAPIEQSIMALEQYNARELDEKWMYELAELYHKAGNSFDCVRICDNIMLMFGLGQYVDKAMILKTRGEGVELTEYQRGLFENREYYEEKLREVEQNSRGGYYHEDGEFDGYRPENTGTLELMDPDLQAEIDAEIARHMRALEGLEEEEAGESAGSQEPHPEMSEPFSQEENQAQQESERRAERKRLDAERAALERAEAERAALERYEAERAEAERAEAERVRARRIELEQMQAERISARRRREEALAETAGKQEEAPVEAEAAVTDIVAAIETEGELSHRAVMIEDEHGRDEENLLPFAAPPEGDGEPLLEAVSSGPSAETGEETASPSESEESPEEDMFEDVVLEEKQTGSMIVAAKTPQSGMETAVETLREMYKSTGVKRPVIKINAGKLNDKGLHTVRERIAAKDLIIEDFCLLNGSNIKELLGMLRSDSLDTTFVLIDVQANIRRLVDAHPSFERLCHVIGEMSPKEEAGETETRQGEDLPLLSATETGTPDVAASFAEAFSEPKQEEAAAVPGEAVREEADRTEEDPFATKRFSLQKEERPVREVKPERPASTLSPSEAQDEDGEILSLDDFAQYASEYAMSIDCSLTGKTMLALYERIEIMDEEGVPLTKQNAVNLIEEAADRAEKPPLMKRMFQKKYDKDGKLILKEEHFIS